MQAARADGLSGEGQGDEHPTGAAAAPRLQHPLQELRWECGAQPMSASLLLLSSHVNTSQEELPLPRVSRWSC